MKSILDNVTTEDICIDAFTQHEFSKIFQHDVPQETVSQWAVTLAKAITQKPFNRDGFLYTLDDILAQFKIYSGMYSLWNNALNILTLGVELYKNEFESTDLVLSTLVFAVTHISNIRYKEEKNEEFLLIDSRMLLREMISNLVLIYDIDSLADELFKSLSELSINTVLVGLYHSPIKSNDKRTARAVDTVIGFDVDTRFNINHSKESTVFFSDYSTIDGFDFERERRTFFFLPLFFKDEEIGALLLPYDTQVPEDVYETLRVNISTAVKGAELMSRIQTLSITDELTGLLNRRGFLQFVKSRLLHFRRETSISPMVLFMDMDGLKAINDTYGHNEGDIAIKAFSNILKDSLREEDIIGRLGGDEFVVLSAVKSNESGEMIIMRLRADIDKYNSKKLHAYNVSASIGSVILHEATDECFEAAMLTADNVLYEEKSKKRKKAAIH
jgi:diguanylate cyclase (GGDEF)-like protein